MCAINQLIMKRATVLLLPIVLAGCASNAHKLPVQSGDLVGVQFTCRLPNNDVAISTRPDEVASQKLSRIYSRRAGNDPVTLVAGAAKSPASGKTTSFEDEVVQRLSDAVLGLSVSHQAQIKLSAESAVLADRERYVKLARVRVRPKEKRMSVEEYKARTGKDPVVGQPFVYDRLVPGRVTGVNEKEVVLGFSARTGEVELPFGKGIIREKEDRYEIVIEAAKGDLLRSGVLVGRVTDLDDQFLTIDFGHPFGGETLSCDLTVESIEPASSTTSTPAIPTPAAAMPPTAPVASFVDITVSP